MVNLNYSSGTGYCEYAGRSTDPKPTVGLATGSKFTEIDTGDEYRFNSVSSAWVKQPQSGGGGNLQSKTATPTTSEQTITADDGYDGLSSVTVEAISPTKSAETYTPTTSDQTISAGSWLAGAQTIKGDANLVAGNIKKDVELFGVTGTYEGSVPVSVEPKDVNFIDYDGTILYSYTAEEFAALDALPANPTHDGLTSQGWNWTLADAKAQVTAMGKCNIGQLYVTTDGKTHIDIELLPTALSPYLGLCGSSGASVDVDWGDGTAHSTVALTGWNNQINTNHTYSAPGKYTIKIGVNSGTYALSASSTVQLLNGNSGVVYENRCYSIAVKAVRLGDVTSLRSNTFLDCYSLEYVTIPSGVSDISASVFSSCYSIKSITFPPHALNSYTYICDACTSLKLVSLPKEMTMIPGYMFNGCRLLQSVPIPYTTTSIDQRVFQTNQSLREIVFPSVTAINQYVFSACACLLKFTVPSSVTSIGQNAFSNCFGLKEIHFKPSSPPSVSNSNAFSSLPTSCTIYVPTGKLNDYKTKSNYPDPNTYTYVEE